MASIKAIIKPELLVWARNRAKVTVEEAASAAEVDADELGAWERGERVPSLRELRTLATKYHFPLAVFYLPEPPEDFQPLRDFRRVREGNRGGLSANLAFHIRNANERRELALELQEEIHEQRRSFEVKALSNDDPESVGETIRQFLGISWEDQKAAAQRMGAFDYWRRKLEDRGILVFVIGGPHYTVELEEMRGFALAKRDLPVIVVNGKDHSQGGKTFTLLHELTHIMLGESAISNGRVGNLRSVAEEDRIERFCDAVAAAALMPTKLVLPFSEVKAQGVREWSDEVLKPLARTFGVSREAFLLRLVVLGRATWDFYMTQRERYKEEYRLTNESAKELKKSTPIKRSVLLMSWNGRRFTRLVLRCYYDQRITLNDVSNYLGAKLKHIPALERAAFGRAT